MKLVLAAAAAVALTPAATAQVIDSVRLGVMDHNIRVVDPKNADKESGVNINGELRFASPKFLGVIGSPHPYVMASGNTDGNTSFAAVGLEWDWEFATGWHLEPGFGYALHDGDKENPFPSGSQEAVDYSAEHVLLGSRDLFRSSLALTLDFSDDWAVQAIYEHLSHGQILGSGHNQGLDELGVRFVHNF
ncbi:MAG: acyloxyacyl hydrolase [Hyphomonadaceae bacterium]